MHINPDHFLQTPRGRIVTPERNAWAWQQCFLALDRELATIGSAARLYVLVGAQGSGKTTWAKARKVAEPPCVIFDAILVKRSERAPILQQARRYAVPAVAVWFRASLEGCLARNAARPPDEAVHEQGLRRVHAAIEEPTEDEGFTSVWQVEIADP